MSAPLLSEHALNEILRTLMIDLVACHHETVSWFRQAGWDQIVVEALPSPHPVRYVIERGTSFPLYVGAVGKAQLAALPEDQVNSYLAKLQPKALTCHVVHPAMLAQDVDAIRRRGYATSFGERIEGAASVAVNVRGALGGDAGVIGIMMPMFRASPANSIGWARIWCGAPADSLNWPEQVFQAKPGGRDDPGSGAP